LTPVRATLRRHKTLLVVTLLALVVRLVWNLAFHNPVDFAYSDMGGYLGRANQMIDRPWLPVKPGPAPHLAFGEIVDWLAPRLFGPRLPHLTLYPYGTHAFLGVVKAVFGKNNRIAIASAMACVGALAVAFTYATAARFTPSARLRRIIAVILITYYPWISLGGYALSEAPYTLCLSAITFYGLRLADEGRRRDAWLLGAWLAIGTVVRPQVLMSVLFLALLFVLRRRTFKNFQFGLAHRAALPLAVVIAVSAWRVHWHMGTKVDADHLISTNGPLNRVFGRCHNTRLEAVTPHRRGFFGPPAFGALLAYEKAHPRPLFRLDPVMGRTLTFKGTMMDAGPNDRLAAQCVRKAGMWRELKFAVTHVVLLWGYNVIWPDMGHKKARFRIPMTVWCVAHSAVIMPPAALAMILAFRRRRSRSMLLALHVWALVVTSMLYFGDTRYRAPYDGILTILAVVMVLEIVRWTRRLRDRLRGWRLARIEARTAVALG
jgi:hypothetical protein